LELKTKEFGPDICFHFNGSRVWIELTAVDEGTGADAVPKVSQHSGYESIPVDRIILRFTNAIAEKYKRLLSYQQQGLVSGNDPYIIAVNSAEIEMSMFDFDFPIPLIVKALYPLGQHVVRIDPEQDRAVEEGYQYRDAIQKKSGSEVPTDTFFDPNYSGISGVVYSLAAFWDPPTGPASELLYVHNSVAANPMPKGWIKAGSDCWNQDDGWMISPN
jgi:type I restriction enzyme S subunit